MAEITTRTVRVFDVPRTLLTDFLKMPESGQVGLYFLFGSSEEASDVCYIGQTGNVGVRLKQHTASKDYWERALVAVSLTNSWTDTHVGYMEWQAIDKAHRADRYRLMNGNGASNRHTPAPLEADCNEYLDTISVLVTTLGFPAMEPIQKKEPDFAPGLGTGASNHHLSFSRPGCEGKGTLTAEGFIVAAGSYGRPSESESCPTWIVNLRRKLLEDGVVEFRNDGVTLVKDHLFNSPTAAAAALVGRSINGRKSWKNASGQTLKELEQMRLDSVEVTDAEELP
ncbi:GIY-YIG nuclease family protein [Pseudarthrobacter equi]|uniref:GIY-YIG nuclease family protein n=1 Tax=Pseudarthrobacter equi TaxID=728066 RepID=UPI0021BF01D7|nr:GIY-YIG nuclease family protein [Pseudarthrobacter equi]